MKSNHSSHPRTLKIKPVKFDEILSGGDLRSIGKSNALVTEIKDQGMFDELFKQLYQDDRKIAMRAADAIEKITCSNPEFLVPHKEEIFALCSAKKEKEVKWHLAQLITRLSLTGKEFNEAWQLLTTWVSDKTESKIVRVNSLQALFSLCQLNPQKASLLNAIIAGLRRENIPSINARLRKLSVNDQ